MKKTTKVYLIIFVLLVINLILLLCNNTTEEQIKLNKEICMETTNKNIIYKCLYKKELFNQEEYNLFLKKNQNINFFNKDLNRDFLIEKVVADNLCKKGCKHILDTSMYNELLRCAKNNEYCSLLTIPYSNEDDICKFKKIKEELFLNENLYVDYINLSNDKKTELCDYREKNHINKETISLSIISDMIKK